jgi:hypothetical protein
MLLLAAWVTPMATMAHAAGEPAAPKDDFSWMRGAAAQVQLPKDVAFFADQTWYYPSDEMLADGYRVLNAAWRPLYTCGGYPAREIYAWSPNIVRHNIDGNINITLPRSDLLLGSLCWVAGPCPR